MTANSRTVQDQFKQNIMIEMENINNIFYMNCIPIYLDSLIRITQEPESSKIPINNINLLCKSSKINEDDDIQDIIVPSEQNLKNNIPIAIKAQDLVFGDEAINVPDKSTNALYFLYFS